LVKSYSAISVPTIHESMGKETKNLMDPAIRPVDIGMRMAGPAVTVDCPPGDSTALHFAMTLCLPGDVLVVNGSGRPVALFGGIMAAQANRSGVAGIVVDGGVRDVGDFRRLGFPCFARFITAQGAVKKKMGDINVPIVCGGLTVNPGDLVVADEDGVVVVPRLKAAEVLEACRKRIAIEKRNVRLIEKGATTVELLGLGKLRTE